MQERLDNEADLASSYGTGFGAYLRGAFKELSLPGMRNRVLLVFCAFTLQNLSGAAGLFLAIFFVSLPL